MSGDPTAGATDEQATPSTPLGTAAEPLFIALPGLAWAMHGQTARAVAARAGLAESTISLLVRGKRRASRRVAGKVADALFLSVES